MIKNGRKSLLWSGALRLADLLRSQFASSAIVACQTWYGKLERALRESRLGRLADHGYDRSSLVYRLRHAGLRSRENSAIVRLLSEWGQRLLNLKLFHIGLSLLLCGITGIGTLVFHAFFLRDFEQCIAAVALIVSALPLLSCGGTLSEALDGSRFVRLFWCTFCGQPADRLQAAPIAHARPIAPVCGLATLCCWVWLCTPFVCCISVLAILALLLLFAIPELNLMLLLLLFPFFQMLPHPTVVICALTLLADLAWLAKALCGRRELRLEPTDLFVLLFCVLLALGGWIGMGRAVDGISLAVLASVYFPCKHLLCNEAWRHRVGFASLIAAFLCSGYGIIQYFWMDLELRWVDLNRFAELGSRVTATFHNPNILAVYLLLQLPIALSECLSEQASGRYRGFCVLSALTIGGCLILTWTRGAWLGMLLELLLWMLFHDRRSLAAGCLLLPFAATGLPFLPKAILYRFLSIGMPGESSIRYRIYTWRGVLRLLAEHPWGIGIGTQAFFSVYPRYALSGIETVMHAHQIYLQIAVELGYVGLLVFGMLVVTLLLRCVAYGQVLGGAYALCGVLVMGMFDHLWYCAGMISLFFIACAFAAAREEAV